jgi:hypothetical protein
MPESSHESSGRLLETTMLSRIFVNLFNALLYAGGNAL